MNIFILWIFLGLASQAGGAQKSPAVAASLALTKKAPYENYFTCITRELCPGQVDWDNMPLDADWIQAITVLALDATSPYRMQMGAFAIYRIGKSCPALDEAVQRHLHLFDLGDHYEFLLNTVVTLERAQAPEAIVTRYRQALEACPLTDEQLLNIYVMRKPTATTTKIAGRLDALHTSRPHEWLYMMALGLENETLFEGKYVSHILHNMAGMTQSPLKQMEILELLLSKHYRLSDENKLLCVRLVQRHFQPPHRRRSYPEVWAKIRMHLTQLLPKDGVPQSEVQVETAILLQEPSHCGHHVPAQSY